MSWLVYSILSAVVLGVYDLFKKLALRDNAVLPVLYGSVWTGALIWIPLVIFSNVSHLPTGWEFFRVDPITGREHVLIFLKSALVTALWICSFNGLKSLPMSIAGPIRASSPFWTVLFAVLFFGESPSLRQWSGLLLILISFFAFSIVGRWEGIHFHRNRGVYFMLGATLLGSISAIYDKILLQNAALSPSTVQAWFSIYLVVAMTPLMLLRLGIKNRGAFHWHWAIPVIGIMVIATDLLYFTAVSQPGAMISLISPVRRTAVVVSFLIGIIFFKEKHFRAKGICIIGIIFGVLLLS